MLDVVNRTPFVVGLFPGLGREGHDEATVLIKATFALGRAGPRVADEQVPVQHGDRHHGDPAVSSVRYECDTSPAKRGTDVILVGHAAARRAVPWLDVTLAAGPVRKGVRVFGDRVWYQGLGAFEPSAPAPFERMPLVWERAFGGVDTSDPDPRKHRCERHNPAGRGLYPPGADVDGLPLPNLEDPLALITAPRDAPRPAGFGFIARSWEPRSSLAGTYDDRWRAERCPLLPLDFDDRHHSAAPLDQIASPHLRGGEPVSVTGASPHGELRFSLPARVIAAAVKIKGRTEARRALLDTVLIEPDEARLVMSYRVTFRCPRQFLFIERITVTEEAA